MKTKKIMLGLGTTALTLAGAAMVANTVVPARAAGETDNTVTSYHIGNSMGAWGGIGIHDVTPALTDPIYDTAPLGAFGLPTGYGDIVHSTGLTLTTFKGVASTPNVEAWGSNFCIGRGATDNMYGYVVSIPANFTVSTEGKTSDGSITKWIFPDAASYICKIDGSVSSTSGDWTPYVAPTSFALKETSASIHLGDNYQIEHTIVSADADPIIQYESETPATATVSATGLVTPLAEGTVNINVYCGLAKYTTALTILPALAAQTGIEITSGNELTVYDHEGGYALKDVVVKAKLADGTYGKTYTLDSTMISGTFDPDADGDYTLTVTADTYTATFVVHVLGVDKALNITGVAPNSGWGRILGITSDLSDDSKHPGATDNCLANFSSHILLNGQANQLKDTLMFSGNTAMTNFLSDLVPGDKISLLKGLRFYSYTGTESGFAVQGDGYWKPVAELKKDAIYVWNGTTYQDWVADPTEFSVVYPEAALYVNCPVTPKITFTPAEALARVNFASSDEIIATVNASTGTINPLKEGNVKITATMGSVSHEFSFTVSVEKQITGLQAVGPDPYMVVKGSDPAAFKPSITSVKKVYADGTTSGACLVDGGTNVTIDPIVTTATGTFAIKFSATVNGASHDGTINVEVYDYFDQVCTTVGIVSWFNYYMFADCPNTSTNAVNITDDNITADMKNYMTYTHKDGTNVPIASIWQLGHNLAIATQDLSDVIGKAVASGNTQDYMDKHFTDAYQEGDMLTFKVGCPVMKWTGDANQTAGTGEYIVEGKVAEERVFRLSSNVFSIYKACTGLTVANPKLTLNVGKTALAGITRNPEDATEGTISFKSSDASIAFVNETTGVIQGVKKGTATITATFTSDVDDTKKYTASVSVTVVDPIVGLNFAEGVSVVSGQPLDLTGVSATYVYTSGKSSDKADLTNATFSGFDTTKVGEQTVIVSVVVDGKTISGELKVTVTEAPKAKSNVGLIVGLSVGGVLLVAGGVVFFVLRHKKKQS